MSSNTKIYVKDFINTSGRIDLQIRLIAGEKGVKKEINVGDINRPGLTLAGFYDFFAYLSGLKDLNAHWMSKSCKLNIRAYHVFSGIDLKVTTVLVRKGLYPSSAI